MPTVEQIRQRVQPVARKYGVTKLSLFGSYAAGRATERSDIDVLVEFPKRYISLITLSGLKIDLEDALGLPVDVVHAPIPPDALIEVEKVVSLYEQAGQDDHSQDLSRRRPARHQ